jgi:threonine dehydrogenase-like Zn-dependent dehydrogenase
MPTEFVVTAPKTIAYHEYTEQPLQPDEVRVRAHVSGIKHGTELALYAGDTPFREKAFDGELRLFVPRENTSFYPCNLGSWLCGDVAEVGAAVTRFKVGDMVHGEMAHRPTNVAREVNLFPLASGMKPEIAVFTDPTIFALGAVHDAQVKVGDRVAIFGLGALGLIAVQIARLNGAAQVFAADRIPARLALAAQFGADEAINAAERDAAMAIKRLTGNRGVDVAIDISGAYGALNTAIRSVQPGGIVVTASYFKGDAGALQLGAEWHHNRLTLVGSMPVWGMPHRCYPLWDLARIRQTALWLLETGKVVVGPMISLRFPYDRAPEAYQLIYEHPEAAVKVLLDYRANA